ncbi:MAG TPA: lysophospholipid acyltransferase family protein [Gemmatimonadota bacterium]|nr:lysophospholipid acyltransferase family protein [Gemmatimonadota bacterium]
MLRTAYAWTLGVVLTLFWSALGLVTWPVSPRGELYLRFARIWSGMILRGLSIPLDVEREAELDPERPYLFMSSHRSVFDIFALFLAIRHSLRMVAKRELFFIPIFGWALWMCGFIPIDRSNRESAIRSLGEAARKVREGISVLVFPEGTRGPGGGLLPFKKGGFVLALEAGVPVVPIAILGSERIMPKGSLSVGRGRIEVRVGRPIPTAGRGSGARDALMDEVRRAIETLERPVAAPSAHG